MRSSTWRLEDLRNVILNLGFVGENLHTRQIFDCKKMFDQYPNASVSMTVTPPEGEPYPGTIERDGDLVIWDVRDSDLVAGGDGEIQLVFTQEPHIARSYNAQTHICRSQVPTGSIPSGLDDYITRADQLLDQVEDTFPAGGTTGQVLAKKSDTDYDTEWVDQGGGTEDYDELENRPQIGGVTLTGNKTLHDLGAASEADVEAKYTKPETGIPASDLAAGVIPDPEDLIDDTAGEGDTDKVWSADKSHELLTEINSRPKTKVTDATNVDLDVTDENGNVLVRFKDGGIQTKKFNSEKADQSVETTSDADLDIIDDDLNVIVRFKDGHIQTKEFDSRQVKKDIIYRNHDVTDGVYAACRWHQRYATDKQFCLLLAGDIHGDQVRLKSLVDYFNFVDAFDGAIMLGDIVGKNWSQPATFYTQIIQNVNKPFLTVLGNHDAGTGTATDQTTIMYTNIDDVYDKFFAPNLQYADLASGEHSGKNTYYYKDFIGQKVRIIVLNQYEYPADLVTDGDAKTFVYPRGYECYSQEQITWLCDTLASTPSDYGVIIALHSYPAWMLINRDHLFTSSTIDTTNTPRLIDHTQNGYIIEEIVNAWTSGTSLSASWDYTVSGSFGVSVSVDVDYTSRGVGEFISYIGGHWHMDLVSATHKYEQPMYNAPSASLTASLQGDTPRREGTRSEDEFTVFAVDRAEKKVKLFKIGGHYTKDGKDRQYGVYEYEGGE